MPKPSQFGHSAKARQSIGDTVAATKPLGICSRLLAIAGLQDMLRGDGDFTLFAPTDAAFNELPDGALASLEQSPEELRDLLEYHILEVGRELAQLANGKLRTLQGTLLTASVTDDGVNLDHANTCGYAISCTNGVVHPINRVLMPGFTPQLSAAAREDSAWSGRPRVALTRKPAAADAWPFIEPPAPAPSSSA
jgi:uncharacterized surface protein with fasciclin (FAS1) repeats